jgi:hypothetical protein
MRVILLLLAASAALSAADGEAEVKRCAGCHGVRIIGTQRLSRAGWERELDKMVRWGAEIKDREGLLAYLVETYGDDKPMPKPVISVDAK